MDMIRFVSLFALALVGAVMIVGTIISLIATESRCRFPRQTIVQIDAKEYCVEPPIR